MHPAPISAPLGENWHRSLVSLVRVPRIQGRGAELSITTSRHHVSGCHRRSLVLYSSVALLYLSESHGHNERVTWNLGLVHGRIPTTSAQRLRKRSNQKHGGRPCIHGLPTIGPVLRWWEQNIPSIYTNINNAEVNIHQTETATGHLRDMILPTPFRRCYNIHSY